MKLIYFQIYKLFFYMFKKFIDKLNKIIQWTKKWHFFHFIAIGNLLYFITVLLFTLKGFNSPYEQTFSFLSLQLNFFLILIFLALPYEIVMLLINFYIHNKTTVKNEHIFDNKLYNTYYFISNFSIIFSVFSVETRNLINDWNNIIAIILCEYVILFPLYLYLNNTLDLNCKKINISDNIKDSELNQFLKYLKILWKYYRTFFLTFLLSLSLGVSSFLIVFATCDMSFEQITFAFVYLIPIFLSWIITFFVTKTSKKHPFFTTIYAYIANFVIIFIIQCVIGYYFLFFYGLTIIDKTYNTPKEYSAAISSINHKEKIIHFPSIIPIDAKDVELYKSSNSWFGSENIMIKFSINAKYIDQELNKYKYISIEKPGGQKHSYYINTNIDGYTFYIINDKEHEQPQEHHFPYHYGIGVNKEKNSIIYYYTNPD